MILNIFLALAVIYGVCERASGEGGGTEDGVNLFLGVLGVLLLGGFDFGNQLVQTCALIDVLGRDGGVGGFFFLGGLRHIAVIPFPGHLPGGGFDNIQKLDIILSVFSLSNWRWDCKRKTRGRGSNCAGGDLPCAAVER